MGGAFDLDSMHATRDADNGQGTHARTISMQMPDSGTHLMRPSAQATMRSCSSRSAALASCARRFEAYSSAATRVSGSARVSNSSSVGAMEVPVGIAFDPARA